MFDYEIIYVQEKQLKMTGPKMVTFLVYKNKADIRCEFNILYSDKYNT